MRSVLGAVLVVAMTLTAYFGARHWQATRGVPRLDTGEGCDLGLAACTHALPGGGRLAIDIEPRPVPLMEKVRFVVRVVNAGVVPEYLELSGLNMEMGLNRVTLEPAGDGRWEGETIIPICSQRRMHWRASLVLRQNGGRVQVDDEFHTSRP